MRTGTHIETLSLLSASDVKQFLVSLMLCACNAWCFSLHRRYIGGGSEKYTPYSIAAVLKNSPGDIFGKQFHPGQRLNELTRPIFSCRDLSSPPRRFSFLPDRFNGLCGLLQTLPQLLQYSPKRNSNRHQS